MRSEKRLQVSPDDTPRAVDVMLIGGENGKYLLLALLN